MAGRAGYMTRLFKLRRRGRRAGLRITRASRCEGAMECLGVDQAALRVADLFGFSPAMKPDKKVKVLGSPAHRRRSAGRRALALFWLFACAPTRGAAALGAQGEPTTLPVGHGPWLPEVRHFPGPVADPREPRFSVALLRTDLLRSPYGGSERPPFRLDDPREARSELQGVAALGGTLPLWQAASWRGGELTVGVQAGIFGRFRMQVASNDLLGTDWLVAIPVEAASGRFSARLRPLHWSAHLGDEFIEETAAARLDFSYEALEVLGALALSEGLRIYGGGSVIARSQTDGDPLFGHGRASDRAALQAGADGIWHPWGFHSIAVEAGVDWQSAQRTGWRNQLSAMVGLSARNHGRRIQLDARYFRGPSVLGQFFLTQV